MSTKFIYRPKATPNSISVKIQDKLNEAVEFHKNGKIDRAKIIYEEIIKTQPKHFDSLHFLGIIASQSKDYPLAISLIEKAIKINPNQANVYYNLGIALQEFQKLDAAVASFDKAIAINPQYTLAYCSLGNLLQKLNQFNTAIANYDKAIDINPDYAEAYSNRGMALHELNQFDAAVASYDKAIAISPAFAAAYSNRGNAFNELNQLNAAVASFDQAIAINPVYAEAYSNRGNALKRLNQLDAAIVNYDKAIAINPYFSEAYLSKGAALNELNQLEAAVDSYDLAIAINPDYVQAYWNKSMTLLLAGDLKNGFDLYEWRWKTETFQLQIINFTQPLWLGVESLKNKTILIHCEQGLGDTIQFCRYIKLISDLGAKVIFKVQQPLVTLLSTCAGVSQLITNKSIFPEHDFHCPLLSLPLAFETQLNNIPNSHAYLNCDDSKVSDWKIKLGTKTKPRIGIVWSGSVAHTNDHNRSVELSSLIPFLPDSLEYFSLQKEVRETDKVVLESNPNIRHFGDELNDFTDTAALCEQMDVVISVDTSVAHLSAAIGKTTWLLLPYSPDWRWLLDRNDSPWYPSMTLYRQSDVGNWASVFKELHAALTKLGTLNHSH